MNIYIYGPLINNSLKICYSQIFCTCSSSVRTVDFELRVTKYDN